MLNTKFKFTISVLVIFVLSTTLYSQTIIRVNCGGDDYWDTERNLWQADQPYSPGSWGYENPGYFLFTDYPVDGTNDDPLYQWEHNALDNYKFTVPNGTYVVTMKFADLYYDNPGDRIFHVDIEGSRVLNNFDIIAEVGFASACDKTFIIDVNDGIMDIQFITIETEPGVTIAHANIKAIGIEEQGTHEPKLWVDPEEIDFFDFSYRQSFKVKNGGELPLEWSCFENPDEPWITNVNPTSGLLYQGQSQYVEVSVTRSGLEDGNYEGSISVASNGGDENVKVLMEVLSKVPNLQVQQSTLNYGAIVTSRAFTIKNSGTADLNWNAKNKNSDNWIKTIIPNSGTLEPGKSQEVQVTTDRAGLAQGVYEGILEVTSNGGTEKVDLILEKSEQPLAINCGGSDYQDNNDLDWLFDFGSIGGQNTSTNAEINNTNDDRLYQYARIGMSKYQFAVQENGFYKIILHFAEIQHDAAGKRIFDVMIEDSLVLHNFDIYVEHGKNYAIIKSAFIEVTDQQLDVSFIKKTGEPCIAGIEIHQIPYLKVEATYLNFASILTKRYFTLKNLGTLALNWTAKNQSAYPGVIEISPATGVLAPHDSQLVTVAIDRANFADSLYQGEIEVETNGGNRNLSLAFETENKPLKINCGGDEYWDQSNTPWFDDMLFSGGNLIRCENEIANTDDDHLYQLTRSGMSDYKFPVHQNGMYKVTLHFAEIQYQSTGSRIFDVKIEDQIVLENFDIFAQASSFSSLIKSAMIEVTDNQLDLSFVSKTGEPCISAIEIYLSPQMALDPISMKFGSLLTRRTFSVMNTGPVDLYWKAENKNNVPWLQQISPANGLLAPSDTQLVAITIDRSGLTDSLYQAILTIETDGGDQSISLALETKNTPLRINCGGAEFWDAKNNLWFDDIHFTGGQLIACQDSIANTSDDPLYQSARSGITRYEFPVQKNGLYGFALHFVEFQHQTVGARVFDVLIEDSLVLSDFDIFADVGSLSALIKSGRIKVDDKQVDIAFVAKTGEPMIAAIEIYQSPLLAVTATDVKFGSMLTKRTFAMVNAGSIDMNWLVKGQNNQPWLNQISPVGGVLAPSDTQLVTITIDRSELADSMVFEGSLQVETDGGNQEISLHFATTDEPLRINCGGAEYLDANQDFWFEDLFASTGQPMSCSDSIANTAQDWLYQSARSGMTKFELPIQTNGLYEFTLHFSEIEHSAAGQRIFDVQIEDSLVLKDFDIYAESGSFSALIKKAKVNINDNQLDIVFLSKTGEPSIAGIEIASTTPVPPTLVGRPDDERLTPTCFQLDQNYPNPFNMETRIAFQLPVSAKVTLEVYNVLGQKQKVLVNQELTPGYHSFNWDGRDLNGASVTSGFYLYKIQVTSKNGQMSSFQQVRKMLLLK